jgi:hypothetical protein
MRTEKGAPAMEQAHLEDISATGREITNTKNGGDHGKAIH